MAHEVRGRRVGREAVVLGHVPHELADDRALLLDIEVHDLIAIGQVLLVVLGYAIGPIIISRRLADLLAASLA